MFKGLLVALGLSPSQEDIELKELVDNSYESLRVVGRGTVRIDQKRYPLLQSLKRLRLKQKLWLKVTYNVPALLKHQALKTTLT